MDSIGDVVKAIADVAGGILNIMNVEQAKGDGLCWREGDAVIFLQHSEPLPKPEPDIGEGGK